MASILDFFSAEAGQNRTKALRRKTGGLIGKLSGAANSLLGPTGIPGKVSSAGKIASMINPVAGMERSMRAAGNNKFGESLIEIGGVVLPAGIVAKYGAKTALAAAKGLQESLTATGSALSGAASRAVTGRKQLTDTETMSQRVLDLLKSGRANEVTDEMLEVADDAYLYRNYDLPVSESRRKAGADEMGFLEENLYHGTHATKDNMKYFDDSKIGRLDEGFYGRGHYLTPDYGMARQYGPNVGKYNVKGNFLDLTDRVGDKTLNDPTYFKWWAEQLKKIDMLDEPTEKGLATLKKIDKHVDDNIEYWKFDNKDGTEGYQARIIDPRRKPDVYKGKTYNATIDTRIDPYAQQGAPLTKEEAKRQAKRRFVDEMTMRRNSPYDGLENILYSLSDYIRAGGKGAHELTEQAQKAGYDGIIAGGEHVVFDPKNIRRASARFDPRLKHLKNLSAAGAGVTTAGLLSQGQNKNRKKAY